MSIEYFADTVTEMTARSHGNQQLSLKSSAMLHRSDKQKKREFILQWCRTKLLLFRSYLNEYSDGEGGGWRIGKWRSCECEVGRNNTKRHIQINATERLRSAKSGLPVNVQAGPVRVGLLEIKPWLQRWVLRITPGLGVGSVESCHVLKDGLSGSCPWLQY